MNNIVSFLPDMLSGKEIMKAMTVLPNYNNNIRRADATKRLLALSDLYQIYIPVSYTHLTLPTNREV